jgi:DNA-binding LytR/AlgR family response regulator
MNPPTALIAEDEPVLAEALQRLLRQVWPGLNVLATVRDGLQACSQALACYPDVVFLDIHMPGIKGLDVAARLVDEWPVERALPLFVFITAYDEYAVRAFDQAAVDYVLKPVRADRLSLACQRVQAQLSHRQMAAPRAPSDETTTAALTSLQRHAPETRSARLQVVQAASGTSVYVVPIDEVVYFEAADKYVRVITARPDAHRPELLLRMPLSELLVRLDPDLFWQIHRGCVVNVRAIERVGRQQRRLSVHLRGRKETLDVSRMYEHLFKAM